MRRPHELEKCTFGLGSPKMASTFAKFLPLAQNNSVLKEGCWIYASYSTRFGKVYVGQTGAEDTPKQVIERCRQHLRATKGYGTLYGSRNIKNMGSIYPMMHHIGVDHFGMIVLEACSPEVADACERRWIHRLTPTLN